MPAADVFFDTNVLLYLLSDDIAKADRAEALVANGGMISVQVLNEFAAVALGKKALNFTELKEVLSAVRVACAIKPLDIQTHELGLDIAERYQFSIHDSLVIAAALLARCSVLYSEDLHHGQRIEQMTIRNPFVV